jgi:hypothetical protein
MANEKGNPLFRAFVSNPKVEKRLLEFYTRRLRKSGFKAFGKVLRKELIDLKNIRPPMPRFLAKHHRKLQRAKAARAQQLELASARGIFGVLPGGYLPPKSRFMLERIKLRQPLRLTGCSLINTRVEIRSGGELIFNASLQAGRETTLEFIALHDDVTITFEDAIKIKGKSGAAFRVIETNLISEQELAQVAQRREDHAEPRRPGSDQA